MKRSSMNGQGVSQRPDWQALPAPRPGLALCVVVPVRDEARRLSATLRALATQRGLDGAALDMTPVEVIVLVNNSQDSSAAVARRFAARHPAMAIHVVEVWFPAPLAHVGQARACLMDEACRRLQHSARAGRPGHPRATDSAARGHFGIIASTDGDSRVDSHWMATTLAEFNAGADAVGGCIRSRAQAGDSRALRNLVRQDALYRHWRARLASLLDPVDADPWPHHHQHFGASLAVRADAYRAVGGCPALPWLEDEALVRALQAHDLRVRHSPQVRVWTSGRRQGRVQVGLSQQLRSWASLAAAGEEPMVADPGHEALHLRVQARLRAAWKAREATDARQALHDLAVLRGLPPAALRQAWQDARHFGAWCQAVQALAPQQPEPVCRQRQAIQALRRMVRAVLSQREPKQAARLQP